jgi:2-amino-4-hydroxy-6-hydroxymethyldihydropteridine diphosphokinase
MRLALMTPPKPHIALIAFGANVGEPAETFTQTLPLLEAAGLGRLLKASSLYETRALTLDGSVQPNYRNAVIAFETTLQPEDILKLLLNVERQLGRIRENEARWSPRAIDLDLLFVGDTVYHSESLTLPHPELHKRDFVLLPLTEIAPDFVHPIERVSIKSLQESLDTRGFERFVIS